MPFCLNSEHEGAWERGVGRIGCMPTQFESPTSSSDEEFKYMAIGMIAGAIPGIIIGLLVAIPFGHAAMWVSVVGGLGVVIGLIASRIAFKKKTKNRHSHL